MKLAVCSPENLENLQDGIFGDELCILQQQIPTEFRDDLYVVPPETANFSDGRRSRVSLLMELPPHSGVPMFIVWKRMAFQRGLDHDEAARLRDGLVEYQRSLTAAGWNIPRALHGSVVEIIGEHQIFWQEQYIEGGDGAKMLSDQGVPDSRKWRLVDDVMRTMQGYRDGELSRRMVDSYELTVLPHGLDLKPENVGLQRYLDRLYLLDTFGPKLLDSDGNWLTYESRLEDLTEDSLRLVTATREGVILRFWRLASECWQSENGVGDDLDVRFLELLRTSQAPPDELEFIAHEISQGYPWLDRIYTEALV